MKNETSRLISRMMASISNFAKCFLTVFAIGFLSVPFLINAGFDSMLVCGFSMSLMLLWTDGFLTLFALGKGATEINPLMNYLNKKMGKKRGVLLSRVVGSILPIVGLLMRSFYFVLLLAWLFSALVCLSSLELVQHFDKSPNVKDTNACKNQ